MTALLTFHAASTDWGNDLLTMRAPSFAKVIGMGSQQQPVMAVQPLPLVAVCPWLYVAGPQKPPVRHACDPTARLNQLHTRPEKALPDPGVDQLLFGCDLEAWVRKNLLHVIHEVSLAKAHDLARAAKDDIRNGTDPISQPKPKAAVVEWTFARWPTLR